MGDEWTAANPDLEGLALVTEREENQGAKDQVRTAVIIVHGMGEQLPVETLNQFVKAALPNVGDARHYFSRPERITDSYEARRMLAYKQPQGLSQTLYGQTEFFEYHWSYMMTDNKLADIVPTLTRLLYRGWFTKLHGIRSAWILAWVVLLALIGTVIYVALKVSPQEWTIAGVLIALLGPGVVVTVILQVINHAGNAVTKSFVDVVRYLDRSPRSYEVRRTIRKGMVDLLTAIHKSGRYSRVVIVGHSLGAYIAYDGLCALWPTMCKLHAGKPRVGGVPPVFQMGECEQAARALFKDPADADALKQYRTAQFELWKALRRQGNPWLITDFISVGTPMYLADLLYTRDHTDFETLIRRNELARCPPVSGAQSVEGKVKAPGFYSFVNQGRRVLAHGTPFAVVRWTNLYFPVRWLFFGDWFGGQLRGLFGAGIADVPIEGGKGSIWPAMAHSQYFAFPDVPYDGAKAQPDDDPKVQPATARLRHFLLLKLSKDDLRDSFEAPSADPATDVTGGA